MKKFLIVAMIAVLSVTLCSCKSKEAQAVDELILLIGEVSLDSEDRITNAEMAYEELSEKDRNKIENYSVLKTAREEYEKIEEERNQTVETTFVLIEEMFAEGQMKAAETECRGLLNHESIKLNADEIAKVNDFLDDIVKTCFAGTYIVIPKYIVQVPYEEDYAQPIEDVLNNNLFGGGALYSCEFETGTDVELAAKRYIAYLDYNFECVSSKSYELGGGVYLYGTESVSSAIEIRIKNSRDLDMYEISIRIASALFDRTKIDSSKTGLTIVDSTQVVK